MVLTEDSKVFPYNENFVPMVCALDKPVVVLPAPIVSRAITRVFCSWTGRIEAERPWVAAQDPQ
jgi:hypothetical protein